MLIKSKYREYKINSQKLDLRYLQQIRVIGDYS